MQNKHIKIAQQIVEQGICKGIACEDCPFLDNVDWGCPAIWKNSHSALVEQAKQYLEGIGMQNKHIKVAQQIVEQGHCFGINCWECQFGTGCQCAALHKNGFGGVVEQAKQYLEGIRMQENKQPELKGGYVVRTEDGWFNVFDKSGEMIYLTKAGGWNPIPYLGKIIEIREYIKGSFNPKPNADNNLEKITKPVWKKQETKQMTVAEVSKFLSTVEIVEA